jgi:chromosome segregation ATPase
MVMRSELKETARKYRELQNRYDEIAAEIEKKRRDAFSAESEDTEEKARELFSDVAESDDRDATPTTEIDELKQQKQDVKENRDDTREDLLEMLVNVTFPLNEEINADDDDDGVCFPYSEPIEQGVLDGIQEVLSDDFENGKVSIGQEEINVDAESVEEAIDAVQHRVKKMRENAEGLLDVDSHVEAVHERDAKVAAMLYVLYEAEEDSLTKKEMEERIGLESGDLRGQLYHVVNDEPYLKKENKDVYLTSMGEEVIKELINRYQVPSIIPDVSNDEDDGDQEVIA